MSTAARMFQYFHHAILLGGAVAVVVYELIGWIDRKVKNYKKEK